MINNKLPVGYHIVTLTPAHMEALMLLQAKVIDALPAHQKNFMFAKTPEQMHQRMTQTGHMQGVVYAGASELKLVAYGGVAFPTAGWPVADMVLHPAASPCVWKELAVVQSCAVDPEHRGKGLHKHLVNAKEELCAKKGKTHLMAEVAAENPASLKGFLDLGYQVIFAGEDPDDGCKLLYVHKNVIAGKMQTVPTRPVGSIDPVGQFDQLRRQLGQGCQGYGVKKTDVGYHLHLARPVAGLN